MAHAPGEGEEGAADTNTNDKALTAPRSLGGGNGDDADDIIDGYKI